MARELVRAIQQARKDEGFEITDRIILYTEMHNNEVAALLKDWGEYIIQQTMASKVLDITEGPRLWRSVELSGTLIVNFAVIKLG
jgi:isoleucyl-tRNA synthetase